MGYKKGIWHTVASDDRFIDNAKDLVKNKVKGINDKDHLGNAPIHYTIFAQQFEMFSLFLLSAADVNALDEDGYSPLMIICDSGTISIDFLKEILKYKPDLSVTTLDGRTALDLAIEGGRERLINIIAKASKIKKVGKFARLLRSN